MSGSKAGEVVLLLPVVLTVAAIAAGVAAYNSARERIRKEREQAMKEQRDNLLKAHKEWLQKLASSTKEMPEQKVRTTREIIAEMVAPLKEGPDTDYSDLKAEALLNKMFAGASEPSVPVLPEGNMAEQCKTVTDNIQGLLSGLNIPMPKAVSTKIERLRQTQDIVEAAALAREIRIDINREKEQIKQEQQEAQEMLGGLPSDFPENVRQLLKEVVAGHERFSAELKNIILKTQQEIEVTRKRKAAEILATTLSGMGYELEPVSASIFTEGGRVHFRKSDWEDSYCVKMSVKGNAINFNMQKTAESKPETDKEMEREWATEFKKVQKELEGKGVRITNVRVNSEPGASAVPVSDAIKLDTKKKTRKTKAKGMYKHLGMEER